TRANTRTNQTSAAFFFNHTTTSATSTLLEFRRVLRTATIVCQQPGQQIKGDVRTTNMWNRLSNGLYASDAYIKRSSTPPRCTERSEERRVGNESKSHCGAKHTSNGSTTHTNSRSTLRHD